jgi:hypothetical protein
MTLEIEREGTLWKNRFEKKLWACRKTVESKQ